MDLRRAQLFLDDKNVEQTVRLQRVIHRPHRYYGNPLYTVGAPWEGTGMVYLGGVHVDPADGLWKAWYATLNPPAYPEITYAVCLIVSTDGLHWTRPELDVYRGHHGECTNIVLDLGAVGGTCAPCVLYEPEHSPRPWTLIISTSAAGTYDYKAYILRSADGIHWDWEQQRPHGVVHGLHDRLTAMRGPDPDYPYVLLSRGREDIRRWGLVRSVHRVAINTEHAQGAPTRVLVPDLEDDPADQVYHAYGFPYEDTYVGLCQWFRETSDPWGEMELLTSTDTVSWQRLRPRRAFFSPPPGGAGSAFDGQIVDTALSAPVRTKQGDLETLWFFYWGGPAMHGNRHLTFGRAMGLAQLRADGFCSLRASRFPGTLVTRPFVWPGGPLHVNASVIGGAGNGALYTEVLSPSLEPIDSLTRGDADPVRGDGVRQVQHWKGDAGALERVTGHSIRLKFYLENIDLFSFRAGPADGIDT